MRIEPFKPEHLKRLLLQPKQETIRPFFENPEYGKLLANDLAYTAFDGSRVLCCAGLIPLWEGRAEAWALMGDDLKRDFLKIHHAVRLFLNASNIRRIEAMVDAQFESAKAWVEMLGFQNEGLMRAYTPDGRDCIRYAKMKGK